MNAVWQIVNNHLALKCGNQILHPNAEEVYAFLNRQNLESIQGISCNSPIDDIVSLKFSSVGAPVSMILENSEKNSVLLRIVSIRRNVEINVDIVEGPIIDHCMNGDLWFYL